MIELKKIVYNKDVELLVIEPESTTVIATALPINDLNINLKAKLQVVLDYCVNELNTQILKYFVYSRSNDNFNIEDTNKNVIIKVVSELDPTEQSYIEDFLAECLTLINN